MRYLHISWCRQDNHDKVWGVIALTNNGGYFTLNKCVTFWGRRGAKLQTKLCEISDWDANEMFLNKQSKGYRHIEIDELNTVYPEFQQDLEKTAFWATLKS